MAPFIPNDESGVNAAEEVHGHQTEEANDSDESDGSDGSDGSEVEEEENDIAAILRLSPMLLIKLVKGSQTISETQAVIDNIGKVEINIGDGLTLLHQAASNNRPDLVEFLCTKGHPTEPKTVAGETPLDQAAWRGAQDAAVLLIKHGADVDCQTHLGYTPLHRTAYYDHPLLARILVMAGADRKMKDSNGEAAYDVAVNQQNEAIQRTLEPEFDAEGIDITNRHTVYNPKHPSFQPEAREALFAAYVEDAARDGAGGAEQGGDDEKDDESDDESDDEEEEEREVCENDKDNIHASSGEDDDGATAKRQKL